MALQTKEKIYVTVSESNCVSLSSRMAMVRLLLVACHTVIDWWTSRQLVSKNINLFAN